MRHFIFTAKTEDEQTHIIDLAYLATGEVCKDDNTITLQFTEPSIGQIVVDYTTWEDCSGEFLRLCTAITDFHDEMNKQMSFFTLDDDFTEH